MVEKGERIVVIEFGISSPSVLRRCLESEELVEADKVYFSSLGEAISFLRVNSVSVVLLYVGGIESVTVLHTFGRLHQYILDLPIIVVGSSSNQGAGLQLLEKGAQDFLVEEQLEVPRLARCVEYAIRRKRVLIELETARAMADVTRQVNLHFFENMSHELRAQLSAIIGNTDLLLENVLSDESREQLETVRSSGQSILTILGDILAISDSGCGSIGVKGDLIVLRSWLSKRLASLFLHARQHDIGFEIEIDEDVPEKVYGDQYRLLHVMLNLASYALNATTAGHVLIKVSLQEKSEEKVVLCIIIAGGCSRDGEAEPVGEDLASTESCRYGYLVRCYGAAGARWEISKQIIQGMGGVFWVEGQSSGSARFFLEVPFGVYKEAREETVGAVSDERGSVVKGQGKFRVLLAEDSPINQRLILRLLEKLGHTIVVVDNGSEVLKRLETEDYDLVLMDIQMPVLDGFQTTHAIREKEAGTGKHLPIVAVTAYAMKGDREKCIEAGMDDYISKPFQIGDFKKIIEKFGGGK